MKTKLSLLFVTLLTALAFVGCASNHPGGNGSGEKKPCKTPVHTPQKGSAERTGISAKYLEQILVSLKPTGIVRSRAGVHGGYSLGRPASGIKVGEVIRHLDGPLAPMACASATAHQTCDNCLDEEVCSLRDLWLDVRNAIADILDQTSIADIISRGQRLEVLKVAYHGG